jgi:hypothetical protein
MSCPTRYFEKASSISPTKAVRYGLGVINTTLKCLLHRYHIRGISLFNRTGTRLTPND